MDEPWSATAFKRVKWLHRNALAREGARRKAFRQADGRLSICQRKAQLWGRGKKEEGAKHNKLVNQVTRLNTSNKSRRRKKDAGST